MEEAERQMHMLAVQIQSSFKIYTEMYKNNMLYVIFSYSAFQREIRNTYFFAKSSELNNSQFLLFYRKKFIQKWNFCNTFGTLLGWYAKCKNENKLLKEWKVGVRFEPVTHRDLAEYKLINSIPHITRPARKSSRLEIRQKRLWMIFFARQIFRRLNLLPIQCSEFLGFIWVNYPHMPLKY